MAAQTLTPKPTLGRIWRIGLIATAIAAAINVALFLVGSLFTFPPDALTQVGQPINLLIMVFATVNAGIAATIGYSVFTRLLSVTNANRAMWIGAVVVLIGMFGTPFGITNVDAAQIIILEITHLVAGLIPVYALTRRV